jgi:hypothetical protein
MEQRAAFLTVLYVQYLHFQFICAVYALFLIRKNFIRFRIGILIFRIRINILKIRFRNINMIAYRNSAEKAVFRIRIRLIRIRDPDPDIVKLIEIIIFSFL